MLYTFNLYRTLCGPKGFCFRDLCADTLLEAQMKHKEIIQRRHKNSISRTFCQYPLIEAQPFCANNLFHYFFMVISYYTQVY